MRGVAVAPDGLTALSGSDDHTLKLWDLTTGKELRTFTGHKEEVSRVAIAPDGRTALSGSFDQTLKLWDLVSGDVLAAFTGEADFSAVAYHASSRLVLAGDGRGSLHLLRHAD